MAEMTPAQVRSARGLLGWTQAKFARAAGVATSTVADYERGHRQLSRVSMQAILHIIEAQGLSIVNGGVRLSSAPMSPSGKKREAKRGRKSVAPLVTDSGKVLSPPDRAGMTGAVERILDAAEQEFLQNGYYRTTVSAIIGRAGGSNRSIYTHFGDKFGIYAAVLARQTDRLFAAIGTVDRSAQTVRAYLVKFGIDVLESCLRPDALAIYRLVIGEAARFPELGRRAWTNAENRLISMLSAYFAEQIDSGALTMADPERDAGMFLTLVRGQLHMRLAFGETADVDRAQIVSQVEDAVDLFLNGVARRRCCEGAQAMIPVN